MTPLPLPFFCPIAGHATVVELPAAIASLRDAPPPAGAPSLPARFLRHADEHTVLGVRAVQKAIAILGRAPGAFDRWAVVAAPCGAGRPASARTLVQLLEGGGVTVSPHVVPQCSLHALASAVSVGLGMHGPNIGIGGGPDALAEGILAAFSILEEPAVAGCWLVFTAWDEEPVLSPRGELPPDTPCRAVALGLDPVDCSGLRMSLWPTAASGKAAGFSLAERDSSLAAFSRRLAGMESASEPDRAGVRWSLPLSWGGLLTLEQGVAAALHAGRRSA